MSESNQGSSFPEWSHKFVASKPYDRPQEIYQGKGAVITVTAGLHFIRGNRSPYFSVTADVRIPGHSDIEMGGCLNDEILRHWPELAPVVALHLSDDDGVPMHAGGNAWYFLAGYWGGLGERYYYGQPKEGSTFFKRPRVPAKSPNECLQAFADYVRLPLDDARALADSLLVPPYGQAMKERFNVLIEAMRPRWKSEAEAAVSLLDSMIAGAAAKAQR